MTSGISTSVLRERLKTAEAELACVVYIDNTERMLMEKTRLEILVSSLKHRIAERELSSGEVL